MHSTGDNLRLLGGRCPEPSDTFHRDGDIKSIGTKTESVAQMKLFRFLLSRTWRHVTTRKSSSPCTALEDSPWHVLKTLTQQARTFASNYHSAFSLMFIGFTPKMTFSVIDGWREVSRPKNRTLWTTEMTREMVGFTAGLWPPVSSLKTHDGILLLREYCSGVVNGPEDLALTLDTFQAGSTTHPA